MGNLDKIEHIVVLMLENRSFDNVLGWLYDPENKSPFKKTPPGEFWGVNTKMNNPRPDEGGLAFVRPGTDPTAPFPDPNEPYEFVYRQLYKRELENSVKQPPPHIRVPNTTDSPRMQGFVIDYANAIEKANAKLKKKCWLFRKPPLKVDPGIIMNCFPPEYLPAINGLAQNYAVCDNWFSSVPTQTFPNRSFVHAATSSGNVYNTWKTGTGLLDFGIFINDTETIYNRLEDEGISWKIYYGGPLILCNALLIQKKLWDYAFTDHFSPYKKGELLRKSFQQDLDEHTLPAYSFIEPNLICSDKYGPENDMHPAYAIAEHGPPTDVRYGDKLIHEIYTSLRKSDYYWEKTLFIITFDEHGGCFDHIPPEAAVAPDDKVIPYTDGWNGGSGFDFKRFGVRVPAVLVSPWIEEGTICHTRFDHTSVIKTVANKWLGGGNLTRRDADATDLSEVLSRSNARRDTPEITLNEPPEFTGCGRTELSALQSDLLLAAAMGFCRKHKKRVDLKALDTGEKIVSRLEDLAEDIFKR